MKRILSHSSFFKYVKSILTHLYLLVPFLAFQFPLCKFQCSSTISFCDFFQKPEVKLTQSEALSSSYKTAWHFEHDSTQSRSLILLSESPCCFTGLTSISLDRRYTQNRNCYPGFSVISSLSVAPRLVSLSFFFFFFLSLFICSKGKKSPFC